MVGIGFLFGFAHSSRRSAIPYKPKIDMFSSRERA